ncbi:hypothetical protein MASR2M50_07420 [Thauera sp.]
MGPNRHHLLECASTEAWTHLRVNMYPDGGIARLRVYGRPVSTLATTAAGALVDLVAMENGGRAVSWNDASFGSSAAALLLPGRGMNMGDGWETRRRREPGNDWCVLELGAPGTVEKIEVDTAFFKGNYPDRCSVQAAYVTGGTDRSITTQSMFWQTLLPEQKLEMDAIHSFTDAGRQARADHPRALQHLPRRRRLAPAPVGQGRGEVGPAAAALAPPPLHRCIRALRRSYRRCRRGVGSRRSAARRDPPFQPAPATTRTPTPFTEAPP